LPRGRPHLEHPSEVERADAEDAGEVEPGGAGAPQHGRVAVQSADPNLHGVRRRAVHEVHLVEQNLGIFQS
jgi:hypothetical protein